MATEVIVDKDIEELLKNIEDTHMQRKVVMFNDDHHSFEEVVGQVKKATKCSIGDAMKITLTAHNTGEAICFVGSQEECEKVQAILQEIDLATDIID